MKDIVNDLSSMKDVLEDMNSHMGQYLDDKTKEISFYCKTCEKYLCLECKENHQIFHTIINIKEIKNKLDNKSHKILHHNLLPDL